jgi:hypothetical protein
LKQIRALKHIGSLKIELKGQNRKEDQNRTLDHHTKAKRFTEA